MGSCSGGVGLAHLGVFSDGVDSQLDDGSVVRPRLRCRSVICWRICSVDLWNGRGFFAWIGR